MSHYIFYLGKGDSEVKEGPFMEICCNVMDYPKKKGQTNEKKGKKERKNEKEMLEKGKRGKRKKNLF